MDSINNHNTPTISNCTGELNSSSDSSKPLESTPKSAKATPQPEFATSIDIFTPPSTSPKTPLCERVLPQKGKSPVETCDLELYSFPIDSEKLASKLDKVLYIRNYIKVYVKE